MQILTQWKDAENYVKEGKVGVFPSDTIYGISCLASSKEGVERIYDIKDRDREKPFIVLIGNMEDLKSFGINLSQVESSLVCEYWPGPVSIILKVGDENLRYLHRGTYSIAFRMPGYEPLRNLLENTGAIVSTSANKSGQNNIVTIEEAVKVFGNEVDFYFDTGILNNPPSKIIKIENNKLEVIRG